MGMRARIAVVSAVLVASFGQYGQASPRLPVADLRTPSAQGVITGEVTEGDTGRPVTGAQITVVGTRLGTLTDAQGRYRITGVPAGEVQVRAQILGFRVLTHTVVVREGAVTTADFTLTTAAVALDELVVSVAVTDATRIEVGTDIEVINAEQEVEAAAIIDLSDLLNARATGVSISEPSGVAGSASRIRIRGATSLTQDNNPIIYVDGIRVSNATGSGPGSHDFGNGQTISRLDDINPNDIANIQVLKGPTAAALYGSEAAAGVILIETKQGTTGQHRITFSTEVGYHEDVTDYPDNYYNVTANAGITNVGDPAIQQWRPVQNPVTGDVFVRHNPLENPRTRPFRKGGIRRYDVNARGGIEGVNYYTSFGYESEDGVVTNNHLDRYSARLNLEARPRDDLQLALNSSFVSSLIRIPDGDRSSLAMHGNGLSGIPTSAYGTLPDGSRGDCLATVLFGSPESACDRQGNQHNSFEKLATVRNEQGVGRFTGSVEARWTPTTWLSHRLAAGVDYIQTKDLNLVPLDPDRPFGDDSRGLIIDRRRTRQVRTVDYAGTLSWRINDRLSARTTIGAQYFGDEAEVVGCKGEGGFASERTIACDASLIFTGSSDRSEIVETGSFVHQQFAFNEYLFATGAVRVDDNSAFGENQGAIWSPSANASLAISRMPFWNYDFLDNLRLRFAWGTAAQAPAPFAANRTFRPVRLEVDGAQVTGISPLAPGNPELTAERNEEFEFGADASLWDDRLGVKLSYYLQETRDAIVQRRVSPSIGFSAPMWVNLGTVENKGFEALVTAQAYRSDDISVDVQLTMSTQDPVITSLGGELPILFGLGPSHQMFREGFAPGALYAEVVESAERDEDGNIVPGSVELAPGNVGDPNNPTHRYLGPVNPTNEQSLGIDVDLFGNLTVHTLFDRAAGHYKYDLSGNFNTLRQTPRDWAFRQVELTPEEQAMIERGFDGAIGYFVSPADFIKWRELRIGYDVPTAWIAAAGVPARSVALSLGARNLYTWTDYRGLDPEGGYDGGSDSHLAAEFRSAPPVRTYFLRMTVAF